ncbi:MAG: phosphoribosylformylglycinamidine cyclo-ligase, partial [Micrococcales bacterium]|nr:phosphoribosylformylglycinamidine cyclo-ligase [Micrococcales bacterium]
ETGTALISGETAEHPGVMAAHEYDLAGAAVGVVDKDQLLGAHLVQAGDVVLGLASSGLHSNGFSLVRAVFERLGWGFERPVAELGRTLGEELLEPTRLYTKACLALAGGLGPKLHGFSHVTGGGLAANLARVIPTGLGAVVSRAAWPVPAIFQVLNGAGAVPWTDLEQTVNLGVGMVAVVDAAAGHQALELLSKAGQAAWPIGQVVDQAELPQVAPGGTDAAVLVQGTKGVSAGQVLLVDAYCRASQPSSPSTAA